MIKTLIQTPIAQHNEMLDTIERLADANTVSGIVSLLAEVCSAKADHIREAWQDEQTAEIWDKMAGELLNGQQRILKIR